MVTNRCVDNYRHQTAVLGCLWKREKIDFFLFYFDLANETTRETALSSSFVAENTHVRADDNGANQPQSHE